MNSNIKCGLSNQEAEKRIKQYGYNEIKKEKKFKALIIFLNQFNNPLIWLLLCAAILAYFTEGKTESIIIFVILIINSFIGFFQEYRAEKTFQLLNKYIIHTAKVIRDNQINEINSKYIVPGDLIYFIVGDIIPADVKLIETKNLSINESALTGESLPVEKKAEDKAFMGTAVESGRGYGVVIATGQKTYFGTVADLLTQKTHLTNFQKNILGLEKLLLKTTISIGLIIFIVNTILHRGILDSLLFALALTLGITPELLPIIITLTLSQGALAMAKKKVITKKLISIENLGNMNILCCDKTGTLTEGIFTLNQYVDLNNAPEEKLLIYALLCFADISGKKSFENPMDTAVWKEAISKDILSKYKDYKVLDKMDFDFNRRRTSCIIQNKTDKILIAKGSTDSIVKTCDSLLINNELIYLTDEQYKFIENKVNTYEANGYRVIAIASKKTDQSSLTIKDENKLTLLGFLIFYDPPKLSAKDSIKKIKELGIEIKILTGDSPIITKGICDQIGLNIVDNKIITGDVLESLTEKQAEEYYLKYNIFARITPLQKFKIIEHLNNNNVTGFLGDGVNDAPALKISEVGISVNSAAGIAKESADIVLLKKSLGVLCDGIIEGRKAFGNTTKYILNTTSSNMGNILTLAIWSMFLPFLPMLPSQILLTNLLTDISLITICTDNIDSDFLIRPNKWSLSLIGWFMICFGSLSALSDIFLIIPMQYIFHVSKEQFRSNWFMFSTVTEILVTFFIRTKKKFYKSYPSYPIIITSTAMLIATVVIPYTTFGLKYFELVRPSNGFLIYMILLVIAYCITTEICKLYFFKYFNHSKLETK